MADGLYDIFAIEQKRLADEARKRGDSAAHAVHIAQADRFWVAQRDHDSRERKARRTQEEAELPPEYVMEEDRKADMAHEMGRHTHIYRRNEIMCRGRLFGKDEFKSVKFRPEMEVDKFLQSYRNTSFYRTLRQDLCPSCLIEARMIRRGIVE